MYVTYEEYSAIRNGNTDVPEIEYMRIAPIADAIIDDWTLERVGRATKDGEELPEIVRHLYASIIENLPAIMDNTKMGKGGLVSSFSNGIDSYSFDVSKSMMEQLEQSLGWMLNLLPVEWISACVSFEGGNKYAR